MNTLPQTMLNPLILVDSYEPSHFNQYPETAVEMSSYLAFRRTMPKLSLSEKVKLAEQVLDEDDPRMVFFGIRYVVETYISKKITHKLIDRALHIYSRHNAGKTKYPFPEAAFRRVVDEFDGIVPLKIEALPDGTVVRAGLPLVQITCDVAGLVPLVSWYEAIIVQLWYGSEVATISRRMRQYVEEAFFKSVDPENYWKRESRVHNFGFRGATCPEAGLISSLAHLLSHGGSDSVIAEDYILMMNEDRPVSESIPAMAHCTVTPWPLEFDAMDNMVDKYGEGAYAIVMDSVNIKNAITNIVPQLKGKIVEKGGFLVYRPDSGDYIEMVLLCLTAAEATFGVTTNQKGYKVINGAGVIQGNGMSPERVPLLYKAVMEAGFSAENVAVGIGGALVQKDLHRDLVSAGFKSNYIRFANGGEKLVMKCPVDAPGKWSLPGKLAVEDGIVYPKDMIQDKDNALKLIFDGTNGGIQPALQGTYDAMRGRVMSQWDSVMETWKDSSVLSHEIRELQKKVVEELTSGME